MSANAKQPPSVLLDYLPAVYQEDAFLGQFLLAFEKLLLGPGDEAKVSSEGLEAKIAGIATLFDPFVTPEEFLPWLAGWTAFSLRADLETPQRREFISKIIRLYRRRGTLRNLQDLLEVFVKGKHRITETTSDQLQIGVSSTVGVNTWIGGGPPHFFTVTISLPRADRSTIERRIEIARSLIDLEKPAHTLYALSVKHPSLKIGEHSTIGVDTLLGTAGEE